MAIRHSAKTLRHIQATHRKPVKKAAPRRKPLEQADIDHFKSRILFLKDEAAEELESLSESMMPPTTAADEQPGEIINSEMTLLMIERQRRLIGFLDAALDRIASGTYGRCATCGNPIDRGRLEAVPYTQYCVNCKSG